MKIKISYGLIFILSCFCYDENYELGKDRLEDDFDGKLYAWRNITNHNLAKREKLGNEDLTYPLILVTGSHGKGSTVKKIAGALTNAGYVAGAYTKPYPTIEERFQVNGTKISPKELFKIYKTMENDYPFKNLNSCSSDRKLIMLWMSYFSVKKVDVGVIEAHLGGLYDNTNYISPMLTVITNHLLEHTNRLGNTIRKIGLHKSGIIKYTVPAVLGHSINIQSLDIYSRHFLSPLIIIYPKKVNYTFDELNVKTAIEACYILKNHNFAKLTKYEIEEGIKGIKVFGRMDYIPLVKQKEFIELSKYPKAVIIDYTTAVPSFEILLREVKEKYPDCQIRLIHTQPKNRDYYSIFDYLSTHVDYLHILGCGITTYECYEKLFPILLTTQKFKEKSVNILSRHKISLKELYKIFNSVENDYPFKNLNLSFSDRRLTMLWMAYFSAKKVEVGIIEAHQGGLYDDANYISPMLTVITNNLIEHPIELGNTIKKIGLHKSGIIKYKAPVVLGHSINIQSLDIYSKQFLSPLTIVYPNKVNHTFDGLNTKTASEACYLLKNNNFTKLTKYEIEEGMRGIKVFGRMDYIPLAMQKEFITLSKYPKAVLIDWGKNVPSFKILFRELKEKCPDCQIRMVLTQMKERDIYGILDYLVKNVDYLHLFGCGSLIYECYENLVLIILTSKKFKEKWVELKSDLDPNAYEYFKATVEYAFELSSQNQQPEIILINQIMPFIYRVFHIKPQFIL